MTTKPKKKRIRKYKYPKERDPNEGPRKKGIKKGYKPAEAARPAEYTGEALAQAAVIAANVKFMDVSNREVKKIDAAMLTRYITLNSHLSENELKERLKDPTISIFEKRIIKSLLGKDSALSFQYMVERLVGKIADRHVHEVADKYANKTTEELMEEKRRLEAEVRIETDYTEIRRGIRTLEPVKEAEIVEASTDASEPKPSEG